MHRFAMLAVAICLLSFGETEAASRRVPSQFATLGAAVAASSSGDTIWVAAGTYTGAGNKNINVTVNLVIFGEQGPELTVLDAQGSGTILTINNGSTIISTIVSGFTFRGANTTAMVVTNSSPLITWCIFADNSGGTGGGFFGNGFGGAITGCTFTGNTAVASGGFTGDGGAIHLANSNSLISDVIVRGNTAGDDGGGIYLRGGNNVVSGCLVAGNTALDGGGIGHGGVATSSIFQCTVASNTASFEGGGIKFDEAASSSLSGTIVWGNCASVAGPQVWSEGSSSVSVICSDLDFTATGTGVTNVIDNVTVDPVFCQALACGKSTGGNYTLTANSPVRNPNNCGDFMGYTDANCSLVAVAPTTWGRIKAGNR